MTRFYWSSVLLILSAAKNVSSQAQLDAGALTALGNNHVIIQMFEWVTCFYRIASRAQAHALRCLGLG